jgi:DNA-binding response OmpR family regulator
VLYRWLLASQCDAAVPANKDAAILDLNLNGKRSDVLAAALTRRNIPFAFVTGYGRDTLPAAFRQAALLSKPFNPSEVAQTLTSLFDTPNRRNYDR